MSKLILLRVPGSVRVKNNIKIIVNFISRIIIYWKLKNNVYDAIIFSDNLYFLNNDFLVYIRKLTHSLIILFSGVSPKTLFPVAHKNSIPYFDKIIISDPGLKTEWGNLGNQNVYVLPLSAACPDTFHNILVNNKQNRDYDIVFIGRLDSPTYDYRLVILDYIVTNGIDIKIWTPDNSDIGVNYPILERQIIGQAHGEKMINILSNSKIALNLHQPSVPSGGNIRLFEIPLTKTLQIADKCPTDWYKNGYDIVLFKNNDDLLIKINYYLKNEKERIRIAKNGYRRLLAEHTYKHRVEKFFNLIQV